MQFPVRCVGRMMGAVLAMTCALSIAAWAGGAGFGKEVDPKDVEVSCDKPGYKQLRVVRRSSPSTDPKIPVETECTLQRI